MRDQELKVCVDCTHHLRAPYPPHHFCKNVASRHNLVTGAAEFTSAAAARAGACGADAVLFTPKPPGLFARIFGCG